MFRCRDRRRGAAWPVTAAAVTAAAASLVATPGLAQGQEVVAPIEDLVFVVESLDGTETVERAEAQVTVTLTSDVLFALDESELTAKARDRLAEVAEQIRADGAGGVVAVAGHTDDQGGDSYNQRLSERRAESVRVSLAEQLAGVDVTFETVGHGESKPREPNLVDGEPDEDNRALNRRVEITYDVPR
jgi:outer membrane protein OmpA-like peptidoglycan-associated protein